MNPSLTGLGTALITPFCEDGSVDYAALTRLIDKQLSSRTPVAPTAGIDYLVVLGTTGETATLTLAEQDAVRQHIVRQVAGRVPLVLGMGGNCTAAVIARINELQDTLQSDFAAILSVCPYYNKPSQEGLYQHFTAIAKASPIPVILYNVPGRTGINLLPETVMRIYDACPDRITGIKEASGNIQQITELIDLANGKLLVISGDDGIACELMNAGADGLISVASNAFPEDMGCLVHEHSMALQQRYAHIIHLLFVEGNPSGIKTVLTEQGLIKNILRLPLVPNTPPTQMVIRRALKSI